MTNPVPNSREVAFRSRGIARNMALDGSFLAAINAYNGPTGRYYVDPNSFEAIPLASGGGNLNGSAATPLFGKSGTNGSKAQLIRTPRSGGNYCGTV